MKRIFLLIFACLVSGMQISAGQKMDLRILYVGGRFDTALQFDEEEIRKSYYEDRMRSFETFLKEYFNHVTAIPAEKYSQRMSYDYDVTVLDGVPEPITPAITDREKGIYMQAGYFTEDFDRPVVTIGGVGDRTGRRIGLKNDWYCLCLDAAAHHWRDGHPIFHGPFAVKMTVEIRPTPEDAYHYPYYYDGPIPDRIPMWNVQTKGYMTDSNMPIGMVARPWGYEDSPDAEYISSGVCQKTLDAVAIGRHGNFLHWGFAASPDYLTEEAKPVLANAIVYISQFAGQTPIARKYSDRIATREYLKELRYLLTREYYEERLESDAKWVEKMLAEKNEVLEKQARGEKLTSRETQKLSYTPMTETRTFEQHLERYGKDFYKMFGTDIKAYGRYFDENYDYFYGGEGSYVLRVDEDVKSLGIPNYDKRLLDKAIRMIEDNRDQEKAKRILTRYTLVDFPTVAQWRDWYETNKDRLFWTEAGGWLFLIDSREPGINDYHAREAQKIITRLQSGQTDDDNPVSFAAEVVPLQRGGGMIYIKMKIHPGYHVYDNIAPGDAFVPTVIKVELPEGYANGGEVVRPSGKYYNERGTTVYEDEIVFSFKFSGTGDGELRCIVSYQCCDTHICFPPATQVLTIKLRK